MKYFILIIFCVACSRNAYYDRSVIENLLAYSFDEPPSLILVDIPVFIKKNRNIIYQTTIYNLKLSYDEYYKTDYNTLSDFVLDAFNQNVKFDYVKFIVDTFKVDSTINEQYLKNKFSDFINLYCTRGTSEYEYILIDENMEDVEKKTLFYLFFKNNYFVSEDDYSRQVKFIHASRF